MRRAPVSASVDLFATMDSAEIAKIFALPLALLGGTTTHPLEVQMRRLVLPTLVTLSFIACGGVDDHPLGGPYGGTTDPTDPNGGQNGTDPNGDPNNTNDDAGTTQQEQQDSGTTQQQQKDSGTQQKDSGTTTPDSGTQTSVTWTTVFNSYLAGSTKGRCWSCHSQARAKRASTPGSRARVTSADLHRLWWTPISPACHGTAATCRPTDPRAGRKPSAT